MKVKNLTIRGFRSLKDVTWQPGNLNVLIGPNASGKSNLLRALEILQHTGTGELENAILRQGGIRSIPWNDHPPGKIEWHVDFDANGWLSDLEILRYELILQSVFGLEIEQELLLGFPTREDQNRPRPFRYIQRDRTNGLLSDLKGLAASVSPIAKAQTVLSLLPKFTNSGITSLPGTMKTWRVFQNLNLQSDAVLRKPVLVRKEDCLAADGQNLVSVLHTLYATEKYFRVEINDAMRAAFGKDFDELEFPPAEGQRIQLRVRWKSLTTPFSSSDLSEGTLKFLMLLAIFVNPSRGWLVAIDEPETYLHPAMFPIFAEFAAEASQNSQIIFTTHSPEFLTAIGPYDPSTAVLQNVEGETKLNILDRQEMKRWLEKYKLGELFISGDLEALV